jgi:hypothetical protein
MKTLIYILIAAILIFLLSSCGNDNPEWDKIVENLHPELSKQEVQNTLNDEKNNKL